MNESKENKPFNWLNFIDILDSSKIGLWSIEIDNNTGINRMYCNDTMIEIIGASKYFTPEKNFEFWYSRIHKGYYSYVEKAIEQICSTNKSIEIQYPWKHPDFGDIIVRCSGKLISIQNGVITIKGYHQNINDLHQMKVVLSKTENEIFEWYQDSNTAYVHTHYSQLYKDESNVENFPQAWIDNGNVQEFFKDVYLETFNRINKGSKKSVCELKMKNKYGEYTWFRMTLSKEELSSDVSNVVIGTLENINNLKQMEISYVIESRFYKAMLKEMVAYGEANITNDKFLATGGIWSSYNNVLDNLTISEIMQKNIYKVIFKEDQDKYIEILNAKNLLKAYNEGRNIVKCEFRRIVSKETIRWMELTISLFQEPYNKDILGLLYLRDIDSKKREELLLKHENITDSLTGLFNKEYVKQEINKILDKSENINAMILLNIVGFKNINHTNDSFIEDEAIKYISNLLKYIFEYDSLISRISYDEFIVFIKSTNENDIKSKLNELRLRLKEFENVEIECKASCCITVNGEFEEVYNKCNSQMYSLKSGYEKDIITYFNNSLQPMKFEDIKSDEAQKDENIKENYSNIYDLILSDSDNLAYVIDAFNYKLVDANEAFFKAVNKSKDECLGKECYKILHKREKPCNLCKSIFWNYKEFFTWNQYNKNLKRDFLLKNKLVTFDNKKCMFTLATSVSLFDEQKAETLNEDIGRIILSITSHLSKKYSYEENIDFILETITTFYKSEFGFVFEINKNNNISVHSVTKTYLSDELKLELESIIKDEFIPSPINCIKYLDCEQDAISISYNLYSFMVKYHLQNMIIIPIINKNIHIGYTICINNSNIEDNVYYNKIEEYSQNISYFIREEMIKNTLKFDLNFEKNYDSLTGVLNRNAYRSYEKVYDADDIKNIGALCLALNELNNINHTAGVLAGDQILLDLANILKIQFYHKPIFRLNGNEFLIIMKNIKYEVFLEEIDILIKSLEKIGLSITYGKAWSSDEKEINHIVNSAIYLRKMENQRNKQLINNNNLYKRNTLLSELMLSIESKEYEIFLQPKVSLEDNKVSGAEALIRKRNLEGGYIPPDKFIPILEHHYLIHYIDLFVFEEVLKLLQCWQKQGKPLIPISLNFSRRTLLEDDIIRQVVEIKDKYDIDPSYIEIEVTESIGDLEKQAICTVLKELESLGISILLDDFGVKYSNLTILSEISFDGLKLDKSMVKNLGINSTNEIIMKNIISMCKDLNIKTIAEGVETIEQENILKTMNCDIVQGYLHSKPLPVSEFIKKYHND